MNILKKLFSFKSRGIFEIFKDKAKQYRFRLKSRNGEIVASSEQYKSKKSCINGIWAVVKCCKRFDVRDKTNG